jgi:uncharacterized membrane protein
MNATARWFVRALLAASVVLNFALGWLLLTPAQPPGSGALVSAAPVAALRRVVQELPDEDRTVLTDALLKRAVAMGNAQWEYEQHAADLLDLVAAENVNVAEVSAEISAARTARQKAADELIGAFLEALPELSPEARRKLAERGNAAATRK